MLEAYLQEIELLNDNLKIIRKNIEAAEDTMTIQLDSARNVILLVDLTFTISGAVFTAGALL